MNKIKNFIKKISKHCEVFISQCTSVYQSNVTTSKKILVAGLACVLVALLVATALLTGMVTSAPETEAVDGTTMAVEAPLAVESTEPVEETKEEKNPTEETVATEETLAVEETVETTEPEETQKSENNSSSNYSDDGVYNTWDTCVGSFSIPSVGLSVNCYSSASQSTVDAKNSAAYFYTQGHSVVADHVNQGFNKIKSCSKGTSAYLAGVEYECVAVMSGHNDGHKLTTSSGEDIRNVYPGTLVAYTCNSNWQNVTMVFFKVAGTEIEDLDTEMGESSDIYPSEDGRAPCAVGSHNWELADSWEYLSYEMEGRARFLHEHFICSRCNADWVKDTLLEHDPDFSWDDEDEEDEEDEDFNEPVVEENTSPTEPVETILPTEPDIEPTEPNVPEETTPPVEDNTSDENDVAPEGPEDSSDYQEEPDTEEFVESTNEDVGEEIVSESPNEETNE